MRARTETGVPLAGPGAPAAEADAEADTDSDSDTDPGNGDPSAKGGRVVHAVSAAAAAVSDAAASMATVDRVTEVPFDRKCPDTDCLWKPRLARTSPGVHG